MSTLTATVNLTDSSGAQTVLTATCAIVDAPPADRPVSITTAALLGVIA